MNEIRNQNNINENRKTTIQMTPIYKYMPGFYPNNQPVFHLQEQSGKLRKIIIDFLEGNRVEGKNFEILKEYVLHWIFFPAFKVDNEIKSSCMSARDTAELREVHNKLVEMEMDIF
ncbi:hypothetical protein [Flexithrix dorotheae]|uniref:hypothetical protein n=1 Tax=Flexithrix dorotheae TaxID=70993 RepID=UPI0003723CB9|nr:hypothetical protein [Flexithrix dorotheae]